MADYNVWADLFDTWQSTSDWVKALVIVVPPVFVATVLALLLHYRQKVREDGPVPSGVYHLSPPQNLQLRPEDMPEPDDMIDHMLLDAATNLQHRLEEARQSLHPQENPGPDLGRAKTRQQITQIILEEYNRGSDPGVALRRGREFLASQQNAHSTNPDVKE
ncbi:protein kinase [Agrobacterium vitis]|uniref:Protein kinase n=2 Tax=Agrobacterium vitis TaxID=373 RepID=A0A6L6VF61_AGRVI|nr:protein kinase [Agrobacterium vitis]